MIPKDIHEKRFSDRTPLRILALAALLSGHLYIYAAACSHLPAPIRALWALIAVLSLLMLSATRTYKRRLTTARALQIWRVFGKFGMCWSVLVLMTAITMSLLTTIYDAPPLTIFTVSLLLSSLLCAYGIFEAHTVRTTHLTITTEKEIGRSIRLVQLSDLHVNPYTSLTHIARIVKSALDTKPDLIVITGDIVDGEVGDESGVFEGYALYAEKLAELSLYMPSLGVWAIPGNHDYFEGLENTSDFLNSAGIRLLRTEKIDLDKHAPAFDTSECGKPDELGEATAGRHTDGAPLPRIVLIGADDSDHLRASDSAPHLTASEDLVRSLTDDEMKKFVILLRHRPVVESSTEGLFDLQLSGHTHGGQLFTMPSSRHRIPGHTRGTISLKGGSELYVSNGTGFVGPPMRFLAPAEVVVIDISRGEQI